MWVPIKLLVPVTLPDSRFPKCLQTTASVAEKNLSHPLKILALFWLFSVALPDSHVQTCSHSLADVHNEVVWQDPVLPRDGGYFNA